MGTVYDAIDEKLRAWLLDQHVFFVGTAPLAADGHINMSPKGLDGSFAVLGPGEVAYLDLTGSGIETIAHLRENGRILLMFCAFAGSPKIVRLHGTGRAVLPGDDGFDDVAAAFTTPLPGALRSIISVRVERVSDSCGFGVPIMQYQKDRPYFPKVGASTPPEEFAKYRAEHNAASIDGLPGLP